MQLMVEKLTDSFTKTSEAAPFHLRAKRSE